MNLLPIIFLLGSLRMPAELQKQLQEAPEAVSSVWFFKAGRFRPSDMFRAEVYGARLRAKSTWLNGTSFLVPNDQIENVGAALSASEVRPVAVMRKSSDERFRLPENFPFYGREQYGESYDQVATINAVDIHKAGYIGDGVVIGVFDTGFDSTHPAISHLWEGHRILAHYDFASGDHIGSYYGTVPVPPMDEVKYVNSMDLKVTDGLILLAYSSATESQLSAYPMVKNKWRIHLLMGYTDPSGNVAWRQDAFELVVDSFAIRPRMTYRDGRVYVAYQAMHRFSGFDIGYVQVDTSGTIYAGPFTIDSSMDNDLDPAILMDGQHILIAYLSLPEGVYVIKQSDDGRNFTIRDTFHVEGTFPGGNCGISTPWGPVFAFSVDSAIHVVVGDQHVTTNLRGTLPSLIFWNDTVHMIYVDGATINHAFINPDGTVGETEVVATDCGLSVPALSVYNDELTIVYANESGELVRRSLQSGSVEQLNAAFADMVVADSDQVVWRFRGDPDVYPENYIPHSGSPRYHGTKVLSVIAGFYPGMLIGVAPGANFILARTEKTMTQDGVNFENQVEEDFWIEALEWAAAHGVNIVSSSLGYADWYRKSDMDGSTAPISRAASRALQRNILVVNAIGNLHHVEFPDPETGDTTLVAPADARGIIAVGAYEVDSVTGQLLPPSGALGPTADGRIKPEVIAPYWTFTAADMYLGNDTTFVTRFVYSAGTSYGTALVSGGAALVWQAHPDWTAEQVREAILQSARPIEIPGYPDAPVPNNIIGWGLIDVASAAGVTAPKKDMTEKDVALVPIPSPARSGKPITLRYRLYRSSYVSLFVYTLSGELVWSHELEGRSIGYNEFVWDGKDKNGKPLAPGLYIFAVRSNASVSTVKFAVLP